MSDRFEPLVIGFTCNWCSYRAADLAGMARRPYPASVRLVRLMCIGRLEPELVIRAFALGADGVLAAGCHPGECHYVEQNVKALRRHALLAPMLRQFGVDPVRLRLVWLSASEGIRFADEASRFVDELRDLGPLDWPGQARDDVTEIRVPAGIST